jgi:hypothetical protein
VPFDDKDEWAGRFCDRSSYFIGPALVWRGREMEAAILWFNLRRQGSPIFAASPPRNKNDGGGVFCDRADENS